VLEQLLVEHPFFAGLDDSTVAMLVGCAANEHFRPGEYLFTRASRPTASS
jgi:CRP/FNR family transcriptional regulator, cyclic AMP receptor protein